MKRPRKASKSLFLLALMPGFLSFAQSGGVRGKIVSEKNEAIPYAGVFIKSIQASASSNAEGNFEINLPPGEYQLSISCLGYLAKQQTVIVGQEWLELEIRLVPTSYTLSEVKIKTGGEDPAYAMMRKAIAMAKFYKFQVQDYTAKSYVKGTAKCNSMPWLYRKLENKHEVDTGRVYLIETVSELHFKQPNSYTEKDLSINTSLPKGIKLNGPMGFVDGSFYEPSIDGNVSPLAPQAFSYYAFKLLGSYFDGGLEIDKISVRPRVPGDDLFEGTLYLVDGLWCLKSLQLKASHEGVNTLITQNYTEIQDKVWMPLTQLFTVYGNFYGFDFTAKYQATTTDYKIKLNPFLGVPPMVLDEKTEQQVQPGAIAKKKTVKKIKADSLLKGKSAFTVKEMKKLMNQVEKEAEKRSPDPEVVSTVNWTVDSMAYKKDSLFWSDARLIPLTGAESKSYRIRDSLNTVKKKEDKAEQKTFSVERDGFRIRLDSNSSLRFVLFSYSNFLYNSVEGFVYRPELRYSKKFKNKNQLFVQPFLRYSEAGQSFTGKGIVSYRYGKKTKQGSLVLEAGKEAVQFNVQQPVSDLLNSITTLFWGYNYMKLYEKESSKLAWSQRLSDKIFLNLSAELADRSMLINSPINAGPVFEDRQRYYTSNVPLTAEIPSTSFVPNRSLSSQLNLNYYLWKTYEIFNGDKREIQSNSPVFFFNYRRGWKDIFGSDVDYDLLQLGMNWRYEPGIKGVLELKIDAGDFIRSDKLCFMDFQHFLGNQTILQEYEDGFRMLSYYGFSTDRYFAQARVKLQLRKLLLTRFAWARTMGLKEILSVNYLYTPELGNYTECSYGLDQIFRIMKCEIVTSMAGLNFKAIGFRIGMRFPIR